jgi:hypothetical protein
MASKTGRRALLFCLALGLVVLNVACREQGATTGDVQVTFEVTPSPPAVGPAVVAVTLRGADGSPVLGATVDVEGNMNHAGMVPVRARAQPRGDGSYVTSDFRFTMAGDWIITAQAVLPDGKKLERSFNLNGVAGEGMAKPGGPMGPMQH